MGLPRDTVRKHDSSQHTTKAEKLVEVRRWKQDGPG